MKDRILYLITMLCNGSNLEFSQKTGINNATLSNLKKEKTNPTLDMVYKIQNAYPDIDLYWLINGTGSMYSSQKNEELDNKLTAVQKSLPFDEPETIEKQDTNTVLNENYTSTNSLKNNSTSENFNRENRDYPTKQSDYVLDKEKKISKIIVVFDDGSVQIR